MSNKKKLPKSCGEIFKLKKLVKFETKVGEIVGPVIKVGENHEISPPYFGLQKCAKLWGNLRNLQYKLVKMQYKLGNNKSAFGTA